VVISHAPSPISEQEHTDERPERLQARLMMVWFKTRVRAASFDPSGKNRSRETRGEYSADRYHLDPQIGDTGVVAFLFERNSTLTQ
jgi:hypothetical protein